MRVVVVGAGAVGGSLAVRLALAGHEVGVVARGANLQAIRAEGLRLREPGGESLARVAASVEPADFGVQDLVVLALKAYDVPAMLPRLGPLLGPRSMLLPMVNGLPWWYLAGTAARPSRIACLDPDGRAADAVDPERIVGCVVYAAAERIGPGLVASSGRLRYVVGEPIQANGARVDALAAELRAAGCVVECSPRIRDAVWSKLARNAAFNPLAALSRLSLDRICGDPGLRELARGVVAEIVAVAHAWGCVPRVRVGDFAAEHALGAVRLSTLQDVERGRQLERDALLCAPLELGARAGIAMPLCACLAALLGGLDAAVTGGNEKSRSVA